MTFDRFTVIPSADDIEIMFLSEVALGKEKHILVEDFSLVEAPKGFDSVVAKGRREPGMSAIISLTLCS